MSQWTKAVITLYMLLVIILISHKMLIVLVVTTLTLITLSTFTMNPINATSLNNNFNNYPLSPSDTTFQWSLFTDTRFNDTHKGWWRWWCSIRQVFANAQYPSCMILPLLSKGFFQSSFVEVEKSPWYVTVGVVYCRIGLNDTVCDIFGSLFVSPNGE